MSIATEITRLQGAKAGLKSAIEAKGVTVSSSALLDAYPALVTSIPSGSVEVEEKDVNFYDYDGTRVYSYTATEAQALTALPDLPDHSSIGLDKTSEYSSWNWTLAAVQALTTGQKADVGACYDTTDKNTHVYLNITNDSLTMWYAFCYSHIDWGDGTEEDNNNKAFISHTYSTAGEYEVILSPLGGNWRPQIGRNSSSYMEAPIRPTETEISGTRDTVLRKVNIGSTYKRSLGYYTLYNCSLLETVTIPINITEGIGDNCFENCYSLTSINFPPSSGYLTFACRYCYSLKRATMSYNMKAPGCSFRGCSNLSSIVPTFNNAGLSTNEFDSCYSLKSIILPDTVNCNIGNVFSNCYSLSDIVIPNSTTGIGMSAFQNCYSLFSITIPSAVTSIGSNAFQNCYSLTYIIMKPSSPPTLQSNSLSNTGSLTKIYVPYSADHSVLDAYKGASNWSNYASKMEELPE